MNVNCQCRNVKLSMIRLSKSIYMLQVAPFFNER